MRELAEISKAALALNIDERTILVNQLADSLHAEQDPEIEGAWDKEIRRRLEEIRSGSVELIDSDVVFSEARRALRK
jgi:putative addiction module component (TIGR02574 family)